MLTCDLKISKDKCKKKVEGHIEIAFSIHFLFSYSMHFHIYPNFSQLPVHFGIRLQLMNEHQQQYYLSRTFGHA